MRMGVNIIGFTMSGPPRMTYANGARHRHTIYVVLKIRHLSPAFEYPEFPVQYRNSGTVVTPVFKPLQSFKQDRICLPWSYISDNSAHGKEGTK